MIRFNVVDDEQHGVQLSIEMNERPKGVYEIG
jgi:hypothetical protein